MVFRILVQLLIISYDKRFFWCFKKYIPIYDMKHKTLHSPLTTLIVQSIRVNFREKK